MIKRLGPPHSSGVPASAILGVEAPLRTETGDTLADVDYLAFPRITAYAELGWSPEPKTTASAAFNDFATRVAAQGPRWDEIGITYYHSSEIPWPTGCRFRPWMRTGRARCALEAQFRARVRNGSRDQHRRRGRSTGRPWRRCGFAHLRRAGRLRIEPGIACFRRIQCARGRETYTGATGPTGQIVSLENDTCLDTAGSSSADGARAQINTCDGAESQQWTAASNGTVLAQGKCLDITGASTTAGTPVELWDCTGGAKQQWQDQNGELVNRVSGLCLNVTSGTDAPGSKLDIAACTGTRPQWFALPAGGYSAGPTEAVTSGITGKCLDVANGQPVDFDAADLCDCNSTQAQVWSLESDGAIESLGMCLDVVGGGATSGTHVDLYTRNGTGAQQWRWSSNGTYDESLTNPQSGLCLDDPGATTTDGTQLQIYSRNGTLAQVWRLP